MEIINGGICGLVDDFDFTVTNCDVADVITEINRFLFHIFLMHILTYTIDGKDELFGNQLFKTMFITALAVLAYHVIFKKLVNSKLKNLQSTCKKTTLTVKPEDESTISKNQ